MENFVLFFYPRNRVQSVVKNSSYKFFLRCLRQPLLNAFALSGLEHQRFRRRIRKGNSVIRPTIKLERFPIGRNFVRRFL